MGRGSESIVPLGTEGQKTQSVVRLPLSLRGWMGVAPRDPAWGGSSALQGRVLSSGQVRTIKYQSNCHVPTGSALTATEVTNSPNLDLGVWRNGGKGGKWGEMGNHQHVRMKRVGTTSRVGAKW